MTDQIPPSLVRFGAELEQALEREISSASRRSRRRGFRLAAASMTALAALAVAVALVVGVTTGVGPAYALTNNGDGSITISLNNLTTGISQLNARLQQMGINDTVIPVTPNCATSTAVLGAAPGSLSETITIGTQNMEPPGVKGYLAAEQLPNGQIGFASGGMKAPLPTCFSPTLMKTQPGSTPEPDGAKLGHDRDEQAGEVGATAAPWGQDLTRSPIWVSTEFTANALPRPRARSGRIRDDQGAGAAWRDTYAPVASLRARMRSGRRRQRPLRFVAPAAARWADSEDGLGNCISLIQGWDRRPGRAVTTAENLPTKHTHSSEICGNVTSGRR